MKYQYLTGIPILKQFRYGKLADYTNGGLSSKADECTLVIPEGILNYQNEPIDLLGGYREIDPLTLPGPVFQLVRRDMLTLGPYFHVEPFGAGRMHFMFGGNSIDYSGNGFHSICRYPIHIHDRRE